MKKLSAVTSYCMALLFLFSPMFVNASRVEPQGNVDVIGDFQLGPGAIEVEAKPGDALTREMLVTNRSGEKKTYQIEIEDFEGHSDPTQGVAFMNKNSGRYGAKDWLKPEFLTFSLEHGERMYFNVAINIPQNADAGDHYGAVFVSEALDPNPEAKEGQNVVIRSRTGTLFYIKVAGEILEGGKLESFKTDKASYEKSPINFGITFRNDGNVRLRPSGKIEIFNSRGKRVDIVQVNEFNVLRNSVKLSSYQWNKKLLIGDYTAKLTLDRGYGGYQDVMETQFKVMPWQDIIIALAVLVAVFGAVILVKKQGKKKRRK